MLPLPSCFITFSLPFSFINLKHTLTFFFSLSLQHGFQHIFVWVPRTLCSVKSRGDVGCWPAANLGQVHSNKFQWQLLLPEPCQSCLHMVGGSVALVFQRAWDFRALNFTGFWIFFNVCEGIKKKKKKSPTSHESVRREKEMSMGLLSRTRSTSCSVFKCFPFSAHWLFFFLIGFFLPLSL